MEISSNTDFSTIYFVPLNKYMRTQAVDPWGKVIADAGGYPTTEEAEVDQHRSISPAPPDPPSIVTVEIDLCSIDSIRQRMPIDVHRSNAAF